MCILGNYWFEILHFDAELECLYSTNHSMLLCLLHTQCSKFYILITLHARMCTYLVERLILEMSLFHSGCHSWQPRWWSCTPVPAAPHTDVFACLGWHTLSEQMDTLGCWWYSIGQCCHHWVVLSRSVWHWLCYHFPQSVNRSRRGLEGALVWEQ